jgi:hypothetical protein
VFFYSQALDLVEMVGALGYLAPYKPVLQDIHQLVIQIIHLAVLLEHLIQL